MVAGKYLERSGFLVLYRNWRWRSGEIDIIAADGHYLVAVEVKTRKKIYSAALQDQVRVPQRKRLMRLLAAFREQHPALVRRLLLWHDRGDLIIVTPYDWCGLLRYLRVARHCKNFFSVAEGRKQ